METLIISSLGVIGSTMFLLFKKSVRNAREIVLEKKIDISFVPSNSVKDLVNISTNRFALRQLYYEVLVIRIFLWGCVLLSCVVLIGAIVLIFGLNLKSPNPDIPIYIRQFIYFSLVLTLVFAFACSFFAGGLKPDE